MFQNNKISEEILSDNHIRKHIEFIRQKSILGF